MCLVGDSISSQQLPFEARARRRIGIIHLRQMRSGPPDPLYYYENLKLEPTSDSFGIQIELGNLAGVIYNLCKKFSGI